MESWTGPPTLVTAYIESRAREFLLGETHPAGLALSRGARDAVARAAPNATILGVFDVRCGEPEVVALIEYMMVAACAYRASRDSRAELCRRAEDALRAALGRLKRLRL